MSRLLDGHRSTLTPWARQRGIRQRRGVVQELSVTGTRRRTTLENLRFFGQLSGLSRPDARIAAVLAYLDFTGHDNERLGGFSKGMRQRVGIAQAILHEPAILFLDEPTSGLDPQGVRTLREIIVGLNRDLRMTVFMNTHLLSEVTRTCTSIGVLRDGELAGGAVDQGQAPVTDVGRYRAVGAVRAAVSAASQRGVRGAAREAGLTAAGESGVD